MATGDDRVTLGQTGVVVRGWSLALLAVVGAVVLGFTLMPGELAGRAYLALHGLCAQNPSRTFTLGGVGLPVDARMTGLYLGCLLAAGPLLLTRRRGVTISRVWLAVLLIGVVIMAMDGLNSLRVDLRLPAWWPPDNHLRLVTGLLAGAGLGVAVVWLVNLAFWPTAAPLLRWPDVAVWVVGAAALAMVVLSGSGWARVPMTLALVLAATLTLTGLNVAIVGLAMTPNSAASATAWTDSARARLALLALLATLAEMALLAGGRLALEAALGRISPIS